MVDRPRSWRGTGRRVVAALVLVLTGALASFAADPDTLWSRGNAAFQAGDLDGARDAFQYLIAAHPRSPHVPYALLELSRLTEDPDSARVCLERIVDQYARSDAAGEAIIALAEADYALGNYDAVLDGLRIATGGRYPVAIRRRALLLVADAALRSDRVTRAIEAFKRVRELSPEPVEDVRALLGLAAVARAEGDHREETRLLAIAERDHPDGDLMPVVLWQWARSLEAQGLIEPAREKMMELLRRFPATPEGAAARDALSPRGDEQAAPLPAIISEHDAELTLWDDLASGGTDDSTRAAGAGPSQGGGASSPETGLFRVRTGRFMTWESADSLRTRLADVTRDSLGIYPDPEGMPPFSVESREFISRAAAEMFAATLEAAGGYIAAVVTAEGEHP